MSNVILQTASGPEPRQNYGDTVEKIVTVVVEKEPVPTYTPAPPPAPEIPIKEKVVTRF